MMQASVILIRLGAFLVSCRRVLIVLAPLLVLDALGGSVLAKKATKKVALLPELGGQVSRAFNLGRSCPTNELLVVGQAADGQGVLRAVYWERVGGQWTIGTLPSLQAGQDSRANAVPPVPCVGDPTQYVAGASRDAGEVLRPVIWQRPDSQSPWTITQLPGLSFGAGGVEVMGVDPTPFMPGPVLAGWSHNDAGISKGAVWQFNGGRGARVVTQLPDLGTPDSDKASQANALSYDALDRLVVVGFAENDSLQRRPVVWRQLDGARGLPSPVELSLCPGCTTGEAMSIYPYPIHPPDPCLVAGWGAVAGDDPQALLWSSEDGGQTFTREDLGVPAGFANSEASAALLNATWLVVGHADDGAPDTAEAMLWEVDPDTMKVTDEMLSDSVANMPPNVMLRAAPAMDGHQNVVGWFDVMPPAEGGAEEAGVGGSGPHAYILTTCGDFDGDGDVDLDDFGAFAACFSGSANPPSPTCPPGVDADCDGDGDVDLDDFAVFAANYTGAQ